MKSRNRNLYAVAATAATAACWITFVAGCSGDTDSASAASSDRSNGTGGGGSSGSSSKSSNDPMLAEAQRFVDAEVKKRWLKTDSGWVTEIPIRTLGGDLTGQTFLIQLRKFEWTVDSFEVSEADRLNGFEWGGEITIEATAVRRYERGQWSSWTDDYLPAIVMNRREGAFRIQANWLDLFDGSKPEAVPE